MELRLLVPAFALALLPSQPRSADWSTTSVLYQHGWNWDPSMGKESRGVLTLESAGGFALGDNFFFLDVTHPVTDTAHRLEVYGQWNPRLSLGKLSKRALSAGPIADLLLTGELGFGAVPADGVYQREYNAGAGVDLRVPGFAYFALNVWLRDTPYRSGVTWQVSPYWGAPFTLGRAGFLFEGFLDWMGPEGVAGEGLGRSAAAVIAQPRLLLDVGSLWNRAGRVYAGTEVAIWWNEFGVEGKDEFVPQLTTKWTL